MKIVRFILRPYLYFDVYNLHFSDFVATDTHTHKTTTLTLATHAL